MKVLATHVNGCAGRGFHALFCELAVSDRFGEHSLTDDPATADVILFLDVNEHQGDLKLGVIARHPLTREFAQKTLIYNELDQPWCVMPGLYVSMPSRGFNRQRQRACGYIMPLLNPYVQGSAREAPGRLAHPDLLFSFIGRRCHSARDRVLRLTHPRAFVEDSSELNVFETTSSLADERMRRYADITLRSKFVLCPRGAGTASFRLFEAMALGRVPVILSDDWVPPAGPDWERFSLRVREGETDRIPAILERAEANFEVMAREARFQWEEWFSADVLFHRMVEACGDLLAGRRLPEAIASRIPNSRYLKLRARGFKTRLKRILKK